MLYKLLMTGVVLFSAFQSTSILAQNLEGTNGPNEQDIIKKFMGELRLSNAKTHWSETIYPDTGWKMHGTTVQGRPLIYFVCGEQNSNTTLMLSSVHGDEVTPTYFGFRLVSWVKGEADLCKDYRIVIAPIINPDGYLSTPPTRTNHNNVDINRNFPTKDFDSNAMTLWKSESKSDRRRFPGTKGGSEKETQFQMWLIDEFKPSKILSVHSPLNFFDYDGPESEDVKNLTKEYVESCNQLRTVIKKASPNYNFLRYGFFPGSLGNYAGKERSIPTLTLELPTTNAKQAKSYFERLKQGTRRLLVYKVLGGSAIASHQK
jgi:protein MpaA